VGGEEFGDIPNIAIEHHPAVIGTVVLCNWRNCQRRTGQAGIQIVPSAASNIFAMLNIGRIQCLRRERKFRMRSRLQLYRDAGREKFPALEELPSNQWLELVIFGDGGQAREPPPFIFLDFGFTKCWAMTSVEED
jgi:hypothetical protein